jgi:hypothetical protein
MLAAVVEEDLVSKCLSVFEGFQDVQLSSCQCSYRLAAQAQSPVVEVGLPSSLTKWCGRWQTVAFRACLFSGRGRDDE